MKNIIDITVTQTRIFPTDSLPFSELRIPTNIAIFQQAFKFGPVKMDPFGVQIMLGNGLFNYRGKSVTILSVVFEQRKISIQIRGRSPAADAFYVAVSKILQSIDDRSGTSKLEPLAKVDDTSCVATLEIDFEDLIAPPLWRFIQTEAKEKMRIDRAKAKSLAFKSLSFEVKYEADAQLAEHDVALANKPFTIEPRAGTPLNERRYFTSSPTDSETHLAIIEGIEREAIKFRSKKST